MKREDVTKAQSRAIAAQLAHDRLGVANSVQDANVTVNHSLYARYGKRAVDIVVSAAALIVTLPVNALIAVGTLIDVGTPIIFAQQRLGKDGEEFTLLKFRNMKNTVDENGELLPAKNRVTKFGKIMRRTSLDELMNFWSIFKGDMSVMGPRPLLPQYRDRFSDRHKMRFAVKPGLECPPREIDVDSWTWFDQFENDVWYVENLTFATDCKMFLQLIKLAFDRKSSRMRSAAKRGTFMGYSEDGLHTISYEQIPDYYLENVIEEEGRQ